VIDPHETPQRCGVTRGGPRVAAFPRGTARGPSQIDDRRRLGSKCPSKRSKAGLFDLRGPTIATGNRHERPMVLAASAALVSAQSPLRLLEESFPPLPPGAYATLGDLDGDVDAVAAGALIWNDRGVAFNAEPDPTIGNPTLVFGQVSGSTYNHEARLADLNGDGHDDLVMVAGALIAFRSSSRSGRCCLTRPRRDCSSSASIRRRRLPSAPPRRSTSRSSRFPHRRA
jgi:hypothetical protein